MATRYTVVFEFPDGMEPPAVGRKDGWLGGEICALQFSDALQENELLKELSAEVLNIADNGETPDGDGVNVPTLLWAEDFKRKLTSNAEVRGCPPNEPEKE